LDTSEFLLDVAGVYDAVPPCPHVPLMRQRHAQVARVFKATARFRPRDPTSSPPHPQRERPFFGMVDAQYYQDHPIHQPARGLCLPSGWVCLRLFIIYIWRFTMNPSSDKSYFDLHITGL